VNRFRCGAGPHAWLRDAMVMPKLTTTMPVPWQSRHRRSNRHENQYRQGEYATHDVSWEYQCCGYPPPLKAQFERTERDVSVKQSIDKRTPS
jgi:hypothetical protein